MLPDDLRQLSRGSILARGCRKSTWVAVPVDGISRGSWTVVKVRSKWEALGSLNPTCHYTKIAHQAACSPTLTPFLLFSTFLQLPEIGSLVSTWKSKTGTF